MPNSYLDLPYELSGFIQSMERFLIRDELKSAHKLIFNLPIEYKQTVKSFVRLQDNPNIEENIGENNSYKFTCEIENKQLTFLISSETKELSIKVFKPEEKK